MAEKKGKVFISYRREGGNYVARSVLIELERRGYDVFLDVDSLGAGRFDEAILREIETRSNFVLILSEGSLNRCNNEKDWVRKEIRHALKSGANIIPVMVDKFDFPEKLPADINAIRNINAVLLTDNSFLHGISKIESFFVEDQAREDLAEKTVEEIAKVASSVSKTTAVKETAKKSPTKKSAGSGAKTYKTTVTNNAKSGATKKLDKKMWFVGAGIAAIAIVAVLGILLFVNRDKVKGDASQVESYGNTSGNLCNGGIASLRGSTSGGSKNLTYLNRLEDDWIYWYDTNKKSIKKKMLGNDSSEVLLEQKKISYLLVTPDWFYYTVGENSGTLYRAARLEDGSEIGEAEELLSGISQENGLIIEENKVYFCKEGKGIYCYNITKQKETLLLEEKATWDYALAGKFDEWIYAYTKDSIWRVNVNTGTMEETVSAELFADRNFTGANIYGSWIYMTVSDTESDLVAEADCVYRIRLDGSQLSRVFAAESLNHTIKVVNLYGEEKLYVEVTSGTEMCVYKVDIKSGEILGISPDDFTGFSAEYDVTEGNSQGNLCNTGFVTRSEADKSTYAGSEHRILQNRFGEGEGFFYDPESRDIYMLCQIEEKKFSANIMIEDVDCSYLYANSEWVYYVIDENNGANLYRAEYNHMEDTIGEPQLLVSGLLSQNGVAIYNKFVYYWMENEGLYQMLLDGRDAELVYAVDEGKSGRGWHTYAVTDKYLYFNVSDKLYWISLESGERACYVNGYNHFEDGEIASAIMADGKTFFSVHYADITKSDEIWVKENGKDPELYLTLPTAESEAGALNVILNTGYVWIETDGEVQLASFALEDASEFHFY